MGKKRKRSVWEKNKNKRTRTAVLVLTSSLLFLLFAFHGFKKNLPPGLNHDAACNGLHALRILNGQPFSVYIPEDYGRESLFHYSLAGFFSFLGVSRYTIEITGIFFGLLSVPFICLLFLLLSDNYGLSLVGSLFWLTSSALIVYSRSGWRLITLIPGVAAATYCAGQYWKKASLFSALSLGIASAYIFYTYNAGRGIVFFLPIYWLIVLWQKKLNRKIIYHSFICLLVFLILGSPMLWYALNNYEMFMGRATTLRNEVGSGSFVNNIKTSLLFFNYKANGGDFFTDFPVLEGMAHFLWLLGLSEAIRKLKKYWYLVLLFLLFLTPTLFVTPSFHRVAGTLPLIYVFVFLGLLKIYRYLEKKRIFLFAKKAIISLIVLVQVFSSANKLYIKKKPFSWGFYPEATALAEFLRKSDYREVVIYGGNWPKYSLYFNALRDPGTIMPETPFDFNDYYFKNYQTYNTKTRDGIQEILLDMEKDEISQEAVFVVGKEKKNVFVEHFEEAGFSPRLIKQVMGSNNQIIALIYSLPEP